MEKYYIRKKLIKARFPHLRWDQVRLVADTINRFYNNADIHRIKATILAIPKDSLNYLMVNMFDLKDFEDALVICYPYRKFLKTLHTPSPQSWETMASPDLVSGMMETLAENQDVIKHKHDKAWQAELIKHLELYDVDTLYNAYFYSDQTYDWTLKDYLEEAIRGDLD